MEESKLKYHPKSKVVKTNMTKKKTSTDGDVVESDICNYDELDDVEYIDGEEICGKFGKDEEWCR